MTWIKSKFILMIGTVVSLWVAAGCQSKFSEPAPEVISTKNAQFDQRASEKSKLDVKLEQIQKATEKIRGLLGAVQNLDDPEQPLGYTPIDLLQEMNFHLTARFPEQDSNGLVRIAKFKLNLNDVDEECKSIEVKLHVSDLRADLTNLKYSIRTCRNNALYFDLANIEVSSAGINYVVNNKELSKVFENIINFKPNEKLLCSYNFIGGDVTNQGIECSNLDIVLPLKEIRIVKLSYMRKRNTEPLTFESIHSFKDHQIRYVTSVQFDGQKPVLKTKQVMDGDNK